ncbi:MAG: hypothetical protein KKB50_18370 [Planctomycetes bacterium]|nr:hypothetical protein [Planctomycetota bacterium]
MAEQDDRQDVLVQRNLRMIGRHLELPSEPTARQRVTWKLNAPAEQSSSRMTQTIRLDRGVRRMRQIRFLTTAGSAVAAAIVLCVFLFVPFKATRVEAATILNSFRESKWNALTLTLEQVGAEGALVNGQILLSFNERVSLRDLVANEDIDVAAVLESLYVDLAVKGEADGDEDLAGLDLTVKFGARPDNGWVFVDLPSLPNKILEEEPFAAVVVPFLRGGLLLDLTDVLAKELWKGGTAKVITDEVASQAALPEDGQLTVSGVVTLDAPPADKQLEELLGSFLSGTASREQIDEIVAAISEAAEDVSVTEVEEGLYVLIARNFHSGDAADQELVAKMELEVAYRDGHGIESANIHHIGAYDGSIRFAFTDNVADMVTSEKERLRAAGVRYFDLSDLEALAESLGASLNMTHDEH